ncbi:MAG: class I SAM-dependent methyltransferase [Actinomycetota bacterium]|nr:class I SAM-dependent methyltransferase [Actinomycetota bacterium]
MTLDPTCSPGTLFAAALRGDNVHLLDGVSRTRPLAVLRWTMTDASDRFVLESCEGATLDVGCGPGRMTTGLAELGAVALGIDVVPEAIDQTRARGAQALLRDVFSQVPGQGRWSTVLLADGNIGIGGDPERLLNRVAELLAPGGRVVVDLAPPGRVSNVRQIRLSGGGLVSDPFKWAMVSVDAIEDVAAAAGLTALRTHDYNGRWFAVLSKARQ